METPPNGQQVERCFLGEYEYAVDAQRRLAIPRAWRRTPAAEGNHFFVFPGRERSLQLVPAEMFQDMIAKLRRVSFADAKAAVALATIGSMAQEVLCDKQGRIALSSKLLAHSGIDDRAVLLGAVTTVQIWEPQAWASLRIDSEKGLDVLQAIQERPDDFTDVFRRLVK